MAQQETKTPAAPAPRPPQKRRWRRWLLGGVALLAAVLILGPIAAAPWLRGKVVSTMEDSLNGSAALDSLSFRLPGNARLAGLRIDDSAGQPVLRLGEATAKVGLLGALRGRYHAELEVENFELHVRRDADGRLNLEKLPRAGGADPGKMEKDRGDRQPRDGGGREPAEEAELPEMSGFVRLRDGKIVLHGRDGATELRELSIDLSLDGRERPATLKLACASYGPSSFGGKIEVNGKLAPPRRMSDLLDALEGELAVLLDGADLAAWQPAAQTFAGAESLSGSASLKLNATAQPGASFGGQLQLAVQKLGYRSSAQQVELAALDAGGRFTLDRQGSGEHSLELRSDFLEASYRGTMEGWTGDAGKLAGDLDLSGDLAKLTAALRGFVPLKEGSSVQGKIAGQMRLRAEQSAGGMPGGEVQGEIRLDELLARDAGGAVIDLGELKNLRLSWSAGADPKADVASLKEIRVEAGPVQARGHGTVSRVYSSEPGVLPLLGESELVVDADLDRLAQDLGKFLDLSGFQFGGKVQVRSSAREDAGRISAQSSATLDDLRLAMSTAAGGVKRLGPLDVQLHQEAELDPAPGGRTTIRRLELRSDFLEADGSGEFTDWADPQALRGSLTQEIRIQPQRFGEVLGDFLGGLRMSGEPVTLSSKVEVDGARWQASGSAAVPGLELSGEAIGQEPVTLTDLQATWSAAPQGSDVAAQLQARTPALVIQLPPAPEATSPRRLVQKDLQLEADVVTSGDGSSLELRKAEYRSSSARLAASGRMDGMQDPATMRARFELRAEGAVAGLLADFAEAAGLQSWQGKGALASQYTVEGAAGAWRVRGDTTVRELELIIPPAPAPEGQQGPQGQPVAIRDREMKIGVDLGLAPTPLDVDVERCVVASSFLNGSMSGEMRNLASLFPVQEGQPAQPDVTLAGLKGDFRYHPDSLGALLSPWLPGKLSGTEEEEAHFQFDGRLQEKSMAALLRTAQGQARLGLAQFSTNGMQTRGDLAMEMEGSRTRANGELELNGGKLQLNAELDARESVPEGEPPPKSHFRVSLLGAQAHAGMSSLIGTIHPVLAGLDPAAGGVLGGLLDLSLDLEYAGVLPAAVLEGDFAALPLDPISGGGRFGLSQAKLGGSPLFGELLGHLGAGAAEELSFEPLEFKVRNGRVRYDKPWKWSVGGVTSSFTGTIGLDQSLKMDWNIPVTRKLVQKYSFLEALQGKELAIPLTGTLSKPKLEFDSFMKNLATDLAKQQLKEGAGEQLGEKLGVPDLGGLLGGDDKNEGPEKKAGRLLERADALYKEGKKEEAKALYIQLRDEYKDTQAFKDNRDRIRNRIQESP